MDLPLNGGYGFNVYVRKIGRIIVEGTKKKEQEGLPAAITNWKCKSFKTSKQVDVIQHRTRKIIWNAWSNGFR